MQSTPPAYRDALARTEQYPKARATVDWHRDDNPSEVRLTSARIDRQITSDLPSEVTLLTGHSVAEASIGLAGNPLDNSQDAAAIYSPYRSDSPLVGLDPEGAPIAVELGYATDAGDVLLPALSGPGRDLPVVAEDATAELEALDGSARTSVTASLPVSVGYDASLTGQGLAPGSGLNSQWPVDILARQGGYYSSPPPRPGCVLSTTLHGSLQADVGVLIGVGTFLTVLPSGVGEFAAPVYEQGRFALAPAAGDRTVFQATYSLAAPVNVHAGITFSGWAFIPPSPGPLPVSDQQWAATDASGNNQTSFEVTTTAPGTTVLELVVTRDNGTLVITGPTTSLTGWVYVGAKLYSSAFAEFRVAGTTTVVPVGTLPTPIGSPDFTVGGVAGAQPAEAVQIDTATSTVGALGFDDAFVPNAILERGEAELIATPPLDATATWWEAIQQIAAAEAGVALIDETDKFRFWSRKHWGADAAATEVQRTITATQSLQRVTISRLADRVRNVVRVTATPLTVGPPAVIWSLADVVAVPARGSLTVGAAFDGKTAFEVSTDTHIIPGGGPQFDLRSGYRAARNADGSGGQVSGLVMTVVPQGATVLITVENPTGWPAWLVSPHGGSSPDPGQGSPGGGGIFPTESDGGPSLAVCGRLIGTTPAGLDGVATPSAQSGITVERRWQPSIDVHGERLLTVSANPWVQRIEDADALARDILHDTAWPMPQLSSVEIVADPALQLGDRVQVVDDSGVTGIGDPFVVVGYTTEFSASGTDAAMTQTVVLRPVAPPGFWILGVPGRSELGLTTKI